VRVRDELYGVSDADPTSSPQTAPVAAWRLVAFALASAPTPLLAAGQGEMCQHPFEPGCFALFSILAGIYALVMGSYTLGALVLFRPRLSRSRWRWGMLGAAPVAFAASLLAFWLGATLGLQSFPLDESPYFFIDWFAVGVVFVLQSIYVALIVATDFSSTESPTTESLATD
jgi:hypothetical protein